MHLFTLGTNPFSPWCCNKGEGHAGYHFVPGSCDVTD